MRRGRSSDRVAAKDKKKKNNKQKQKSSSSSSSASVTSSLELVTLNIDDIIHDPNQPRKQFDDESMQELSDSIKVKGLLQIIMVRKLSNGKYRLIDGARRWRVCKYMLKLKEIPALVDNSIKTKNDITIESLILNLQRDNLTPVDTENAIYRLHKQNKMSTREIGRLIGKSHTMVENYIKAKVDRDKLSNPLASALANNELAPVVSTATIVETATIKDDNARVEFIKMIHRGKIPEAGNVQHLREYVKAVNEASADVREAFFDGTLNIQQVKERTERRKNYEKLKALDASEKQELAKLAPTPETFKPPVGNEERIRFEQDPRPNPDITRLRHDIFVLQQQINRGWAGIFQYIQRL
jgi:ParB/RepB/Spo0J family partition protein